MSDRHLYALREGEATTFVGRVRGMLRLRDSAGWAALASNLERLYPRPLLYPDRGTLSLDGPALFTASHYGYFSAAGSLSDLELSEVPDCEDATLAWLMMNVLLHTSMHRTCLLSCSLPDALLDERFRTMAQGSSAEAQLSLLSDTVLAHRRELPDSLQWLATASHLHGHATAQEVAQFCALEEHSRGLEKLGAACNSEGHFASRALGEEILRLVWFMRLANLDGLLVFATPYPLEL
jgi:hypothetical protein